jgi:hypothetical protein
VVPILIGGAIVLSAFGTTDTRDRPQHPTHG